ncbi:lipopolysaccharide export system protein LptA [Bryocella elongata]|uniref:Lipopolysaccharide export system protein LptA n=1 Tax=Bryocella elongata TaxID=863522 RepID=A0A1H5Z898_9BACT|nr:LptA/OstA family protein [Bryocella elongata]SEG32749.1 lipopolysaccharide export system protein LptA [Bryocella elongata]
MRFSIERLRWFLVAGAVLLIAGLVATIAISSYRAKKAFVEKLKNFAHIAHETKNFTYSDALLGHTSYTLHAGRVVQHGDGTYSLFDVAVQLHSKTSTEVDHIYANEIEYDQNTGVGKAIGEVRMELEVPQSVAGTRHGTQSPPTAAVTTSPQVVFVDTSSVVYVKKLGVAATADEVRFRWGKLSARAKGAEFSPNDSTLRLLADVHATGILHQQQLDMTASEALIDRNSNIATFGHPTARTGNRTGKSDSAIVYLRKDGSIEHGSATGNVELTEGTALIKAAHLDAVLNESSVLESAKLIGGVTMVDSNPLRPTQGSAQTVDASFDATGAPTVIVGRGQAAVAMQQGAPGGRTMHRAMHGDTITANFVHDAKHAGAGHAGNDAHSSASLIKGLHAVGSAQVSGDSVTAAQGKAAELKQNAVDADDLVASFTQTAEGRALLRTLVGTGHTKLHQEGSEGDVSESRADVLNADFVPSATGAAQLETAKQTGHLTMMSRSVRKPAASGQAPGSSKGPATPTVSTGSAAEGTYVAATDTLTLVGGTHFSDGENSLTANEVTVHEGSGDAEARGNVLASIEQHDAQPSGKVREAQPVTHIASTEAKFVRAGKIAEFRGTDGAPARLWQGGSQVQAANLLFDGVRRSLTARPAGSSGLVRAVFASMGGTGQVVGAKKASGERKTAATIVHVASPRLDYSDLSRQAVFSGGVKIEGTMGQVESQRAVATLNPSKPAAPAADGPASSAAAQANPVNGTLEKVVVYGDVHMRQPGRTGTGDQLTYTAADDEYVLTGSPPHLPHIVDAQQGNVTGATLVFNNAGSTIIVSGNPGQPGGRVRTETEVRQSH